MLYSPQAAKKSDTLSDRTTTIRLLRQSALKNKQTEQPQVIVIKSMVVQDCFSETWRTQGEETLGSVGPPQ